MDGLYLPLLAMAASLALAIGAFARFQPARLDLEARRDACEVGRILAGGRPAPATDARRGALLPYAILVLGMVGGLGLFMFGCLR